LQPLLTATHDAAAQATAAATVVAGANDDLLSARASGSDAVETVEPGTRIPDLVLDTGQLPGSTLTRLATAAGVDAALAETVEPGTRIPDLVLAAEQLKGGVIGEGAFGPGGLRSIRAALPAAFPGTIRQKTIGGKQQLVAIGPTGTQTTISDGTADDYLEGMRGGVVALTSTRSDGIETAIERPYTVFPDGRTMLRQSADRRMLILVEMGESLADGGGDPGGGSDIPQAGPRKPGTAMMMTGGVRLDTPDSTATVVSDAALAGMVPLVEAGKQTALGPLAWRLWADCGVHAVGINTAVSGQRYEFIKKGTNPYANGMRALASAIAQARAHGYEPVVVKIVGLGVNDSGSGSDYTYMQPMLREFYADFSADARALLGDQSAPIHSFYWTPVSVGVHQATNSVQTDWTAGGMAELRHPFIHYVGPLTGIPYYDQHHPSGTGQVIMGDSLLYRPIRAVVIEGSTWTPLRPVPGSAVRTGNTLRFTMEGATGGLQRLTDAWSPALTNWGIQTFTAADVEVAVTAVALDGADVVLTLAANPGANCVIAGALNSPGATNAPADKARTNIADRDPLVSSFDGRPFPKRVAQFRLTVA
jgi:hypothetical protein